MSTMMVASQVDMPPLVARLFADLRGCREGQAVCLLARGTFKVWTLHYRDRGMNWQPLPKAANHSFGVGEWLFDHGLVRMEGKRLVLL